jgi:hypothetical protein
MGLPAEKPHFSRADYLIWEHDQPERHEYVAGEVFAMVGVRKSARPIASFTPTFSSPAKRLPIRWSSAMLP